MELRIADRFYVGFLCLSFFQKMNQWRRYEGVDDTQYPNEEYVGSLTNGSTGTVWSGGSGTNFIIKPIYFGCSKNTEALNIHIETEKPFGLYQLSFDGHITEEQVQDVLNSSNTNVNISSGEIICFGVVKNLSIKHKSNLCKFVVGSRKINKNSGEHFEYKKRYKKHCNHCPC